MTSKIAKLQRERQTILEIHKGDFYCFHQAGKTQFCFGLVQGCTLIHTWLADCTVVDEVVSSWFTIWSALSYSFSYSFSYSLSYSLSYSFPLLSFSSLSSFSSFLISGTRGRGGLCDLGGSGDEVMLGLLGSFQRTSITHQSCKIYVGTAWAPNF